MPATAHVAWFKASEYFGVKIRLVPLKADFTPDLKKLKRLINRNTVMILGSAPEYPHGTIDPIEEMGAIAAEERHSPACGCLCGWIYSPVYGNEWRVAATVGLPGARRYLHFGRYPQVRLRGKGRLYDHLSQPRLPALPDVRLPELARWRVRLVGLAGHAPRWCLCGRLGCYPVFWQVGLSQAGAGHAGGGKPLESGHSRHPGPGNYGLSTGAAVLLPVHRPAS